MDVMILFSLVFMAIGFTVIGLLTKYKIFSLFSAGVFLVLIVELKDYTALVIVFVGLIIYQLWYATLGGGN